MGAESTMLLIVAASLFTLIFFVGSLYSEQSASSDATPFQSYSGGSGEFNSNVLAADPPKISLRRLVRGEDRFRLDQNGFACNFELHSELCVAQTPVVIDNNALTVVVPSNQSKSKRTIRPYPRRNEATAMNLVTPIQIFTGNIVTPACDFNHSVPAVVFSSGGFTGNLFHEFNELIIPLFISCRHFRSRLKFIIADHRPWWVERYKPILSRLSEHEVINPAADGRVHCFPGVVVGLKYHDHLALNPTKIPGGQSMFEFRHLLRESYDLKTKAVPELSDSKPVLLFISRPNSRRFLNEADILRMIKALGFRIVVATDDTMLSLHNFAKVVNSCSVMVGAHGAGLTSTLFLPDGALVVQVVPLGLEWASQAYFGGPARDMGLHYVEYKIQPEESSLYDKYGRDDPVINDPESVFAKGYHVGRAVYVDGQDFNINVERLRETLVLAMDRLQLSDPAF